jgi:hypothetical protein
MQRGEECSSPRKVTLGLCNIRLNRERIHVVRRNIENLITLSQRLGEAPKYHAGLCVQGK